MQKILLVLLLILTTTSANATQMCARRDTTVIPLDASVGNGKIWDDRWEWVWYIQLGYGTIYGASTCLSLQDVRDIEGKQELTTYVSLLSTDEDTIQGRDDYYNGDTSNKEYERKFCYCKLTHPMSSSSWVFQGSSDVLTCSKDCGLYCSRTLNTDTVLRTKIFNTIGYGYEDIDPNEYDQSISLN
ncbi:MAG: hypothetical protein R8N24_04730 [Alphaproteobacteria bacterium]|nr:hypothetical protein [Alphaproteobacteria bacterium]